MQFFILALVALSFASAMGSLDPMGWQPPPPPPPPPPPSDPNTPPDSPNYEKQAQAGERESNDKGRGFSLSMSGTGGKSTAMASFGLSAPCGYWVMVKTCTHTYAASNDVYGIKFWEPTNGVYKDLKFPLNKANDKKRGSWDAYGVILRKYIPLPPTWIKISNERPRNRWPIDNWQIKTVILLDSCFGKIYEFSCDCCWMKYHQQYYYPYKEEMYTWIKRTFP
ncbi:unnamed protein product [Owenia fusiformis]|uniref:Uncharacterized protein n=1 Tax=Owenia fusiformis TaxID=6347 RepID=A0A8J1XKP4_OWEFU|nr:unnamed protein product [Owenia fusiformis]